jgi:hypothetical protein
MTLPDLPQGLVRSGSIFKIQSEEPSQTEGPKAAEPVAQGEKQLTTPKMDIKERTKKYFDIYKGIKNKQIGQSLGFTGKYAIFARLKGFLTTGETRETAKLDLVKKGGSFTETEMQNIPKYKAAQDKLQKAEESLKKAKENLEDENSPGSYAPTEHYVFSAPEVPSLKVVAKRMIDNDIKADTYPDRIKVLENEIARLARSGGEGVRDQISAKTKQLNGLKKEFTDLTIQVFNDKAELDKHHVNHKPYNNYIDNLFKKKYRLIKLGYEVQQLGNEVQQKKAELAKAEAELKEFQ